MIGIVVITHGALSEQLLATASLIMGAPENVHAITFTSRDSLDDLRKNAGEAIAPYLEEGCLVLTDIMGGSATNICVEFMKNEKVEVITGVNLPMLLDAIGRREVAEIKELSRKVQESGVKSIINLKEFFEKRAVKRT
jgi:PTS system mannose-specific IIA component